MNPSKRCREDGENTDHGLVLTKKNKIVHLESDSVIRCDSVSLQMTVLVPFSASPIVTGSTTPIARPISKRMQALASKTDMNPLQLLEWLLNSFHRQDNLASLLPAIDQKAHHSFGHGIGHIIKNARHLPSKSTMASKEALSILADWLVANGCW